MGLATIFKMVQENKTEVHLHNMRDQLAEARKRVQTRDSLIVEMEPLVDGPVR